MHTITTLYKISLLSYMNILYSSQQCKIISFLFFFFKKLTFFVSISLSDKNYQSMLLPPNEWSWDQDPVPHTPLMHKMTLNLYKDICVPPLKNTSCSAFFLHFLLQNYYSTRTNVCIVSFYTNLLYS